MTLSVANKKLDILENFHLVIVFEKARKVSKACLAIPNKTLTKCSKKVGISDLVKERTMNDDGDIFNGLDIEMGVFQIRS